MIKDFIPKPYDGATSLPAYVENIEVYSLIANAPGGYSITLARLTVGDSVSAENYLAHALFESFTDHGKRAKAAKTRASGYDRKFIAMKNAMIDTGVEFFPTLAEPFTSVLEKLGEWFAVKNPELSDIEVVSQMCH